MPHWPTLAWQGIRPYGRYLYYSLFPGRRPGYFRQPWTFPAASLENRPTAIFLPMTDWHARLQRSSHLARALAAASRQSLYVNPHLGLEFRLPYAFDRGPHTTALAPGILEFHIHLPCEHEMHTRAFTRAESARIANAVSQVVSRAAVPSAALVVSFPAWLEAALELRRRHGFPILYDCHDWLPGFGRTAPALLDAETALFEAADAVIVSSQFLYDHVVANHPLRARPVIIRNAVDPLGLVPAARSGANSVIGYLGALDHWFDVEAVSAIASAHSQARVELAGRVEDSRVLALRRHPNVHFLGEVARAGLPALLQGWDAAMIPFVVNDLTLAADPIKLYEYFAAGLPVVSAPLPEVERYRPLVYIADSPAAFAGMASVAIKEKDEELCSRRIAAASSETWDARARELLRCIDALLPSNMPPWPR
jgi:glycosyltransferase involved in cell wall biosynthesis